MRWAEQQLGGEPGSTPRPARSRAEAAANAARELGADPAEIARVGRHSSKTAGRRRERVPVRADAGALAAALAQRWSLRPDAARELSDDWLPALLAAGGQLSTLKAFWAAGFGRGQHRLVEHCLTYKIGPEDLSTRVDGRRIGEALLGGAPVALLARRLRDHESR